MEYTSPSPRLLIGIPKGRMEELILTKLNGFGFNFTKDASRSLVICDNEYGIDLLPLKSNDILTFVKNGVADYGIVGRDVLDEMQGQFKIIKEMPIGICRMSVSGPPQLKLSQMRYLKIATKYPIQAKNVLKKLGMAGDVLTVNSSVEIAPLLKLSDCILDIIETGKTLEDNGLAELFCVNDIRSQLFYTTSQKKLPDLFTDALCMNGA